MESCSNVRLTSPPGYDDHFCYKPMCWETYVGQQFYKLTVMDFIIQILLVFFFDLPRVLAFRNCQVINYPARLAFFQGFCEPPFNFKIFGGFLN